MIDIIYKLELWLINKTTVIMSLIFPVIPIDKKLHLLWGFMMSLLVGLFDPLLGLIVCALLALLKELVDYYSKRGCPDAGDFIATIIGGILAWLLIKGMSI